MMIKIGYFADGKWGHETFQKLIEDKDIKIAFIVVRYDHKDPILLEYAKMHEIDVFYHKNINSPEFLDKIKKYSCDLFVSMSFNQIFKKEIINLPQLKTINCHAGKLPYYRGRNILNWVLINDEKEFGITVHYMDEGIDTGDIILQRTFPITNDDTYETLLNIAYNECANILYDAIKLIQNGNVKPIIQDTIDSIGMYCGRRVEGDEVINWNQSSRSIFNFVRAICYPGPMARSILKGKEIKINKVKIYQDAKTYININGQVIGKKDGHPLVKTNDTFVELIEFEYDGKILIGDRFELETRRK